LSGRHRRAFGTKILGELPDRWVHQQDDWKPEQAAEHKENGKPREPPEAAG
jgi:hypothetical protein